MLLSASTLFGQNTLSDHNKKSNSYPDSIYNPYPITVIKKNPIVRLYSVYYFTYDAIHVKWEENQTSEERFYDNNGLLEQKLISSWVNGNRSFYHYDPSGLFIRELQEIWDTNTYDWKPFTLIDYKHNEAGLVVEKKYQSWAGTKWVNFVLYDYSYKIYKIP